MKTIIFIFLIFLLTLNLKSQDFAPIGAKWHYTEGFAFSGNISYLSIESVGDTLIKGKNCRILNNNGGLMCGYYSAKDFVYSQDSVVYFYVAQIDSFQILYNLKVKKDSSWTIIFGTNISQNLDTIRVNVDSVRSVLINGINLKKLFVTYEYLNSSYSYFYYTGEIIEKIGNKNHLFEGLYSSGIACDGNYSEGLRCYEDTQLGFYSTGIADSCTYTSVGIVENTVAKSFEIFPNPTTGKFFITIDSEKNTTIELRNIIGQIIYSKEFYLQTQIDLDGFTNGVYFATLKHQNKVFGVKKVIKY